MSSNNVVSISTICNSNAIADYSPPANPSAGGYQRRAKKNNSQSVIDVIVVLVALPSLTILALLLEANTRGPWLTSAQSRYIVLGLGLTLAVVCIALLMYITSRLGGKMWSGAIPSDGNGPSYSYYNSQSSSADINDLPPCYDSVMGFDIPPPPYHAIIIENAEKCAILIEDSPKYHTIQHI